MAHGLNGLDTDFAFDKMVVPYFLRGIVKLKVSYFLGKDLPIF